MAVEIHTLANGLRVYLSENREQPWIACRVVIRAGAAQEPGETTGLAHYLEHMLANKGTRRLGTRDPDGERPHLDGLRELYERLRALDHAHPQRRELLRTIDAENQAANRWAIANEFKQTYGLLGARSLNAYTSHDRTVYVVEVPSNRLEAWATLEGDRFAHPVFRGFPTELETIIEEKNRALDKAGRALALASSARLWAGHPYGRDVLGEVDHLLRPSIAATERFFATWYVPNNMAVVLAGDFDARRALELVEAHFGALLPAELPPRDTPVPPQAAGEQRVELTHRGDEEVRLSWRTVARRHSDGDALLLADMMLDNRSTGLLNTRLEQPQRLRAAGAAPSLRRQGGSQTVWGRPRVGQSLDEVEGLLREQVAALRAGDFRTSELDDLIANFEVGELRRLESNPARAALMVDAFTHELEWDRVRTRLHRLAAIDRDRIVEVAQRWLGPDLVVARRREGEPELTPIPAFGLTELTLDSQSRSHFAGEVLELPAEPLAVQVLAAGRDFERREVPAGLLYRAPNPNNDLAQLTLRSHFGSASDPVLAKALALWHRAGVGELDLEGYRRAMFHEAASVAVDCRRQQTDVTVAGRAEVLARVLPLIRARLREPVLGEDERRRWAEDIVGKRQQRRETADFKFQVLKQWALRGQQSPYLCEALSNEQVLALELDQLRAAPARLLEHERIIVYAGPQDAATLDELLAPELAAGAPAPAYQALRLRTPTDTEIYLLHHDAAQVKLAIYAPSERYDPRRAALYRVFHEYVGGSAGLVFQEVREARGLAYSAHAGHTAGPRTGDQNMIWASAATRPQRAGETLALLLELLRQLPAQPERFVRARTSAVEKLVGGRVRFRGYGFAAESWRLRGLDGDPRPRVLSELRSLELEELLGFAAELRETGMAAVVVGDLSSLELSELEALGRVHTCELDELAVY